MKHAGMFEYQRNGRWEILFARTVRRARNAAKVRDVHFLKPSKDTPERALLRAIYGPSRKGKP